jgi:hypothetical protein
MPRGRAFHPAILRQNAGSFISGDARMSSIGTVNNSHVPVVSGNPPPAPPPAKPAGDADGDNDGTPPAPANSSHAVDVKT